MLCIGNATIDRTFALTVDPVPASKNPAIARPPAFGGVARNVAENLARLGVRVSLMACVGDDADGRAILADCARLGIDVTGCVASADFPTPQYVALLDAQNELYIGGSDMRALEALPADRVGAPASADVAWTLADCNLSSAALAALIAAPRAAGHRLALDTVSVAKAVRLPPRLLGVDLLFANLAEARALLGEGAAPPETVAHRLAALGARTTVLTLGPGGAYVADAGRPLVHLPAAAAQVADASGAGDALIAGTLFALLGGAETLAAVRTGMLVAALALEASGPVNPLLSPALLRTRSA